MQSDTDSGEDAQDALQMTAELQPPGYERKEQEKLAHKSWRRNGIINNVGSQQCERNANHSLQQTTTKALQQQQQHDNNQQTICHAGNNQMSSQGPTMDGGRHSENQNVDKSKAGGNSQQADELRISKILRRLLNENNATKASELCDKLEIAVRAPSNAAYICRSFQYIMDTMLELLNHCPTQVLPKCSQIMGLVGYINHKDFTVYRKYMTLSYECFVNLRKYLMLALKTTIKEDCTHLHLLPRSNRLLTTLKDFLENADKAENFIAVSETIAQFSENYIRTFENHFTDVVDIIVGWHLETDQPQSLKLHCSAMLQHFSGYFLKTLNFAIRLLGQFLEDLMLMGEELNMEKNSLTQKQKVEMRVGAFVGAFTSIIKALSIKQELTVWSAGQQVLNDAFIVILELYNKILSLNLATEDTILQLNDYFYFLFTHKYQHQQQAQVQHVIMWQLAHLSEGSKKANSSLLCLILSFIRQQRTQLPCKMVTLLFEPTAQNNLMQIQLNQNAQLYRLLLGIYHEILLIKNVPLLQEAYKHIKMDIAANMLLLQQNKHNMLAQIKLSFYLSALSVLATQTSSIIGMYALNPSILELLIVNFRTLDLQLWHKYSVLHAALVELLIEHCQKNHNFRTSSRLLQALNEDNNSSPASENFTQILTFLADILMQHQLLQANTLKRLLNWLHTLLQELEAIHFYTLLQQQEFQQICASLTQNSKVAPIISRKCMITLLQQHVDLPQHLLLNWRNMALQHLDSLDLKLQKYNMQLLAHLPVPVLMIKDKLTYEQHVAKLNDLQYWQKSAAVNSQLQAKYIKPFLEALHYVSSSACPTDLWQLFSNMFINSWMLQLREKPLEYEQTATGSCSLLSSWLQHEVARFCVRNKLRTPLGKPQDTFLGIEAVIMQYARLFAQNNNNDTENDTLEKRIFMHTKVRLLLGFLECLEKHMFNAAEGTAFALQPVEKAAKTFFRINTQTCHSWLARIRSSTQLMAMHALQPHMVIRFAQNMLSSAHTNEAALIMLASALLSCAESDMLQGLYAWLKSKTGQRHMWLQHAAAQAAGNTEAAAEGYLLLLNDKHAKLSTAVREFVEQQVISCMYNHAAWQQLQAVEFADLNKTYNVNHLKTLHELVFGDTSINVACGIQSAAAYAAISELVSWNEDNQQVSYSFDKIVADLEQSCIQNLLQVNNQPLPDSVLQAVQQLAADALLHELPQSSELLLLNKVANALHMGNFNKQQHLIYDSEENSKLLTKSLMWTLLFHLRQHVTTQTHAITCTLYLNLAHSARREGNKQFAMNLLQRCYEFKGLQGNFVDQVQDFNINCQNEQLLQACDELTHCLWATPTQQMQSIVLNAKICQQLLETQTGSSYSSKMLMTLADWIACKHAEELTACAPLQQLLKQLPALPASSEVQMPAADKAVGQLLQASILQVQALPEAWNVFGSWCYRWGKKLVEFKNDGGKLSAADMSQIGQIIGEEVPAELVAVLNNLQLNDAMEDIETSEISTNEMLEIELRKLSILAQRPVEQINSIIEIWRNAHKNVFAYYELAAKAYFKYLAIEAPQSTLSDASFVTITLRILRLVVKHAIGLQDTLEEGLQNTPLRPWRTIIPQLFSRLNHHEPYVRKSVAELLCRLAQHRPHLVIFPAVVGAQQELSDSVDNKQLKCCFSNLLGTLQQQAPDTVLHVQLLVKELKRVALLWEEHWMNALAQLYAEYTPLFSNLEAEIKKSGVNRSQAESRRLQAKYALLMQHVLTDFRKIANSTAKSAETNYERNFQERYEQLIASTVSSLQQPLNFNKPNEHWLNIKQLYNAFQQRALRNTASTLKIQDLSPVLANMRDTAICMPGVDNYASEEHIYIKAVESAVFVLPTKTKPKKLSFLGSDGRKYTYLFKGLEDLHLDERIMQFLAITNAMMARAATDNVLNTMYFKAHHYSVIPLGPQSGLISWVDGVTPLFSIYKKWQQRDALLKQQQKERPNGKQEATTAAPVAPVVTRPSEIFYNKLTPLLAEQNIKITDPRKQWPLATLRRVLTELSQETPRDLLSKELWCYANSAADWRKAVRCYTQSVAVMSVIGYVIGLGDRHLDNVLIKLSTGEIVHIDYNVCFEKGKTLRVPEKVPFRMTPNIEDALGLTGVEGAFRLGCEHVLKTLRKERETLLTLLEAFVYDPLMDWTVGDDGSATATRTTSAHAATLALAALNEPNSASVTGKEESAQKSTEIIWRKEDWPTTRQNIQMRLNELKPSWLKYKEEMCTEFIRIDGNIAQLIRKREDLALTERQRSNISKETALINELQALGSAQGSHALNTLSQRYAAYKKSAELFNNVKLHVQQCQQDYEQLCESYFAGLLDTEKLCFLQIQLHQRGLQVNEYDMLQAILEQNGHKQLYDLYDFTRKEMDNTLVQQSRSSSVCMDLLMRYANIIKFSSRKLMAEKRCVKYAEWYKKLLDEEATAEMLLQASLEYAESENVPAKRELALKYNKAMEQKWLALNYEFESSVMDLNVLKSKDIMPVEIAIYGLREFVSLNTQLHVPAVQLSLSQMLQKTNKAFLQYEQNALKQGEKNLLEQQINYIEMFKTVCQTVFDGMSPLLQHRYEALTTLHELLQCLLQLQTDLEISLPNQILQLYMWHDDNNNYISALQTMCLAAKTAEELSNSPEFNSCVDLIACLENLQVHFSKIELKVMELQSKEREIMDTSEPSSYKEVASEKLYSEYCLQSLRNEAIEKLFVAGRQAALSINNNDVEKVYDLNDLLEPISQYINQLQMHCLLGSTAFFCHELALACTQQLDMKTSTIEPIVMSDSLVHCQNLVLALQHATTLKNQEAQSFIYSKYAEHYCLVSSAHFWLHNLSDQTAKHIVQRDSILQKIQMSYQTLEVWQKTVAKIQQDIEEHTSSVLQMPLIETYRLNFYEIVQQKGAQLTTQQQACQQLMEHVNTLLRFENPEDLVTIQTLLKQWQNAYNSWRQAGAAISAIERDIVQLLDPEGKVDQCWIENITGLLDDMSYTVQRQLANIEREEQMLQEILQADALQVQQFIEATVRVEIRHLLKSIAKLDKQPRNANTEMSALVARVRDLQHKLKIFYNKLAELQMKLSARDFAERALVKLKELVGELLAIIEDRHADFLQIVQRSLNNSLANSPMKTNSESDSTDHMDKKMIINRQQKRNAYAVSVWKRIRMKLEGRDPDPNRRSNINEQVDYIIREAMHVDNLAVLYEGWTPWV